MTDESPATKADILALGENLRAYFKDEFGQRLDKMDQRLDKMDQRLNRLERRLEEGLHEIEVKLTKRMDDFAASLEEQIRDSQTEVLKAMLTTQESNLARFKEVDALRERVGILERRLLDIEMRLTSYPRPNWLSRRPLARLQ